MCDLCAQNACIENLHADHICAQDIETGDLSVSDTLSVCGKIDIGKDW